MSPSSRIRMSSSSKIIHNLKLYAEGNLLSPKIKKYPYPGFSPTNTGLPLAIENDSPWPRHPERSGPPQQSPEGGRLRDDARRLRGSRRGLRQDHKGESPHSLDGAWVVDAADVFDWEWCVSRAGFSVALLDKVWAVLLFNKKRKTERLRRNATSFQLHF